MRDSATLSATTRWRTYLCRAGHFQAAFPSKPTVANETVHDSGLSYTRHILTLASPHIVVEADDFSGVDGARDMRAEIAYEISRFERMFHLRVLSAARDATLRGLSGKRLLVETVGGERLDLEVIGSSSSRLYVLYAADGQVFTKVNESFKSV